MKAFTSIEDWRIFQNRNCCKCSILPEDFWENYMQESGCPIFEALSYSWITYGEVSEGIFEKIKTGTCTDRKILFEVPKNQLAIRAILTPQPEEDKIES